MKRRKFFAVLAAFALIFTAFGCNSDGGDSGTSGGSSTSGGTDSIGPAPEGFVTVPGVLIKGNETWIPESKVFISGREIEIAPFYMSDHEVTRGEYKEIRGKDPSTATAYDKDGNELSGDDVLNNPVTNVNWFDAIIYCNKLSIKQGLTPCYYFSSDPSRDPSDWGSEPLTGRNWSGIECDFGANGYRLPTEAEWEWAARGGQNFKYAGSDNHDEVAWTDNNGTHDVKTKKNNAYGIYDMSGNVGEWCWDWFNNTRYESDSITTETPWIGFSECTEKRCSRGDGWTNWGTDYATIAGHSGGDPIGKGGTGGFRVVRSGEVFYYGPYR